MVSLNPCTDAILAEVADPEQVLGLSHFSFDVASSSIDVTLARQFPSVGDSVEEVLAIKPDVVLAGSFIAPATADALQGLGMRLERLGIARNLAESEAQVRAIAHIAGHPERGEALVARMRAALAAAAPPAGSPALPAPALSAVVWQSGGMVPGDDSLIADLLRQTGFANFSAARGLRQADILPLETMLADPPRVILAAGNPHADEDRLLRHPALAALKNTKRVELQSSLLWCGGPTVIRAAARLAEIRRGMQPVSLAVVPSS